MRELPPVPPHRGLALTPGPGSKTGLESIPSVADRLHRVRERIEVVTRRCGRDPASVTLIGASKRQPIDRLSDAFEAGLGTFGENRVQEAAEKAPLLPAAADWHLIGPLQTNKAKRAVGIFGTVHSVDRLRIAEALSRLSAANGRRLRCFLEINLGAEPAKHGFAPASLPEALPQLAALGGLEIVGLMAIPPRESDATAARGWFTRLARLRDTIDESGELTDFDGALSMGMSGDFEAAIEEGATHVRIGTAIFGARAR